MLKLADIGYAILPIERWEYKKFLPFALMIGITVFNFTMLRNMKDTLVLTAPESGAEAVTYLKTLGVLPIVILCSALYVRLRKNVSFERSYNLIISMFLSCIAVFIFVLYPNSQTPHMSPESVAALKAAYLEYSLYSQSLVYGLIPYSILLQSLGVQFVYPFYSGSLQMIILVQKRLSVFIHILIVML